jgi:hypothetical protein
MNENSNIIEAEVVTDTAKFDGTIDSEMIEAAISRSFNENVEAALAYLRGAKDRISQTEGLDQEAVVRNMGVIPFTLLHELFQDYGDDGTCKRRTIASFESWEEIYPDVVSSSENANCSCRGRVINKFSQNYEKTVEIFENLLKNYSGVIVEDVFFNFFNKVDKMFEGKFGQANKGDKGEARQHKMEKMRRAQAENSFFGVQITIPKAAYKETLESLKASGSGFRGLSVLQSPSSEELIEVYFY